MPPNEKLSVSNSLKTSAESENVPEKIQEDEGTFLDKFHSSYRPLLDHPSRRMSIYRWIQGKREDDNIG